MTFMYDKIITYVSVAYLPSSLDLFTWKYFKTILLWSNFNSMPKHMLHGSPNCTFFYLSSIFKIKDKVSNYL